MASLEVFTEAYKKAGLEAVTAPGADVLRLRPGVVDLYIVAPDNMSAGRSRTYTMEAGQATLFLEVRDSTTGRAARPRARPACDTQQRNGADLEQRHEHLGLQGALQAVGRHQREKDSRDMRAMSPVPMDLKPGQKLN